MQRILSLGTLAVLGGLVWMFLSGGGLNQLAPAPGSAPPATATPAQSTSWTNGFGFLSPSTPASPSTAPVAGNGGGAQFPSTAVGAGAPMGVGPTIRIASFNIEAFGKTKADKPYVMATLAEIIRQFHVVAIQEIRSQDDYLIPNFVKLINSTGRRYDHIIGPRLGNTTSTEQYVFIYDTERVEASLPTVYTVGDPDNLLHREPLVASFRTRGVNPDEAFTFTLVNVHTDPDVVGDEVQALAEVYRVVRREGRDEDDVIMLGDFNADDQHLGRLGQIPGIAPLIRGVYTNTRQNKLYDNIIIHQGSTTEYAGRSGVYDVIRQYNLTLAQAEQVSDHFPVWAEFSVYERDYAGNIASRRNAVR